MLQIIKGLFSKDNQGSVAVTDTKIIDSFISNPDFPFLVSFPRTGSHWLRMLMELYFEKPSLVRAFYYTKSKDFNCYHHHDEDLQLFRKNVIYLFRDAVPTIFSQMNYYKEDTDNRDRILYWTNLYARHLDKWLITDNFTTKKTIVRYENLRDNMGPEFAKICAHFGLEFNEMRLKEVSSKVSKEKLKEKTAHDQQVVNLSSNYDMSRKRFFDYSEFIHEKMIEVNPSLKPFIK